MTTTTAPTTDLRGAGTSTSAQATDRSPSWRTTWLMAGAAIVVVASGTVVAGIQLSDSAASPSARVAHSSTARSDAAGPSHGLGPARAAAADSASVTAAQIAHGTRSSLSDAAGRPLVP
jgi:hypothetical protein